MQKKSLTLSEIISRYQSQISSVLGEQNLTVCDLNTPDQATATSLTFANSKQLVEAAAHSLAACVLAPEKLKESATKLAPNKTWVFSKNVDLLARNLKNDFFFKTPYRGSTSGIHATANIHPSSELGSDVIVGPHAYIGAGCKIGNSCFIGTNAVVEDNCQIGNNTTVHPLVYIGHTTIVGNDCEILPNTTVASEGFGYAHDEKGNHYRIPHTGRVIIEDRVHIGAGSTIDRGTIGDSVIGSGTIIDNQVHFGHNVSVGKNCIFTANVGVAGSTKIGNNFVCGGQTAITGHITICDNVQVGGLSGVHNDITEPGQYTGYPLEPLKQSLKNKASYTHLSDMRKKLDKLTKKIFPDGD